MFTEPSFANASHRRHASLVALAVILGVATYHASAQGAAPEPAPAAGPQIGKPRPPDAARPTATSAAASPDTRTTPRAKPVSGGGDAPHGALAMTRQIAQATAWLRPLPASGAPAGVTPSFWKAIVPADNAPSDARIALGRKLFFETRLSRDGTVACATCHDVSRGFTDRRGTSEGIDDKLGQRNAPTVLNAAFYQTQFWDGRAVTLEDQAKLPIVNPIEMGQPDGNAATSGIKNDPEYQSAFMAAYGRGVNFDDAARAMATFQRTLIFLDAPFDRFAAGDVGAIDDEAKAGWMLFNGKARCASCHQMNSSNPIGTDNRFHNVGVAARHRDFEDLAKKGLALLARDSSQEAIDRLALQTDLSELGRFVVTRNRAEIGAFKTSQIRNIGVTAPYMHDGSMATLWDVIDHYNKGGEANPYLDGGIEPLALTNREVDQLVAFLFTLTDTRLEGQNRSEMDRQRTIARTNRPLRDEATANRKVLLFERRAMTQR